MSRKVKIPLKMANESRVRNLEELKENFDLESILGYYDNGRLIEWLESHYYDEEANKIKALDSSSLDFKKEICEIFGANYSADKADKVSLEDVKSKNTRREKLKKFTADDKILAAIDRVAFTQEELDNLLNKGVKEIYLCGGAV